VLPCELFSSHTSIDKKNKIKEKEKNIQYSKLKEKKYKY